MAPPHRLAGCRASMERPYTWAGPHPSCPSRSMCPIGDRSGRQQSCWALGRRSLSSGCTRQCRLGDSCYSTCRNRERSASSMSSSCSARCRQSSPQCLATASGASTGSSPAPRGTRSRSERLPGSASCWSQHRLLGADLRCTGPCCARATRSSGSPASTPADHTAGRRRRSPCSGRCLLWTHRAALELNPRTCTATQSHTGCFHSRGHSRAGSSIQSVGGSPRNNTFAPVPPPESSCRKCHSSLNSSEHTCPPPGSRRAGCSASRKASTGSAQSWTPR
mmetsp:Transcript_25029/g.78963  ORF Transcript_25029/g.78963 Transcript_25029/m.78963 type:complete len:278 (-) Transcript_25029:137-970(-)